MRTPYRIDDFQQAYFVLDQLDELLRLAEIDFAPSYQRIDGASEYQPGEVLPTDVVIYVARERTTQQSGRSGRMNLEIRP